MAKKAAAKSPDTNKLASQAGRKRAAAPHKPESLLDVYSAAMQAAKTKTRSRHIMQGGEDTYNLGLAIPFPVQALIGCEVLQLGIMVELNGPPQSMKTMLMYQFARWFADHGGWMEMILTENKVAKELVRSVVGWDADSRRRVKIVGVHSMDEMQQEITQRISTLTTVAETGAAGAKAVGYRAPVLYGVDSIMGTTALETSNKIRKEGSAGRSHPVEALMLTPFLKDVASAIGGKPLILLTINHRKEDEPDPSAPYAPVRFTKPGGKQLRFQATYELVTHARKLPTVPDPRPNGSGEIHNRMLRIDVGKNSSGTDGRSINVRVSWRYVIVNKKMPDGTTRPVSRQVTKFHWEEATIRLLMDWVAGGKSDTQTNKKMREDKLHSIVHIALDTTTRAWSKTFGIQKKDSIPLETMGKILLQHDDLMDRIRALMGIADGYVWDTSADYRKALQSLQDHALGSGLDDLDEQATEIHHDSLSDDSILSAYERVAVDGTVADDTADDEDESQAAPPAKTKGGLTRGRTRSYG